MCNCENPEEIGFSMERMVKSAVTAAKDLVTRDFVPPGVEASRLNACLTCPHRGNLIFGKQEDKVLKTDTCLLCGCRIKGWIGVLPPKAKLKNSVCDSGRWPE